MCPFLERKEQNPISTPELLKITNKVLSSPKNSKNKENQKTTNQNSLTRLIHSIGGLLNKQNGSICIEESLKQTDTTANCSPHRSWHPPFGYYGESNKTNTQPTTLFFAGFSSLDFL